ncbi:hypothetical protein DBP12_03130 [Streptomyces sp. CS014]|nr:hypothetical protein DBP12_03130 [Streptomyces sp. CS014]
MIGALGRKKRPAPWATVRSTVKSPWFQNVLTSHYRNICGLPTVDPTLRTPAQQRADEYNKVLAARARLEDRAGVPADRTSAPQVVRITTPPPAPAPKVEAPAVSKKPCPVCGEGGVPVGLSRHGKCERGIRTPAPDPKVSAPAKSRGEAAPTGRYRELVAATEARETKTAGKRVSSSARPVRIPQARRAVILRSEGRCENPGCTGHPDEITDTGEPLLEVDHVHELADGGRDHPEQMIALCPNCHAVKTRGSTRHHLIKILSVVARERHEAWTAR